MKNLLCIIILSTSFCAIAELPQDKMINCQSAKEYITTFRYLEEQKVFSLKKDDMMKIADTVSKGCSGAAKRFIEINDLLVKAQVETSDSIKISMKISAKNDQTANAFMTIFKETFLKEYLDLDIKSAIDFSMKLALEENSDPEMIKNDFQKIVKFCLDQQGLDLSGPKCSDLAAKVALSGTKYKMEMAPVFQQHFDFLIDKEGVDISTYKALQMSIKLTGSGPLSVENFKDAYKFAMSKSGLDLEKGAAIKYAEIMAQRSILEAGSK